MSFFRALRLSFVSGYQLRIELEGEIFGELDLTDALCIPAFEALRSEAMFRSGQIDTDGVITWPCGIGIETQRLFKHLKLQMFEMGAEFTMSGARWRCTDLGTRTIAAIKLDRGDDSPWYRGPPYAVAEMVIDEYDLEACELLPEYMLRARKRFDELGCSPGTREIDGLLKPRGEIRHPFWARRKDDGVARVGRGPVSVSRSELEAVLRERRQDPSTVLRWPPSRKVWLQLEELFDQYIAHESPTNTRRKQ